MPKAEIRNGKLMILLSDELREKLDVHAAANSRHTSFREA